MLHKSHYLLEHKSFSSRWEDSISTEENVWVCYLVYLETVKLILAKGNPHFVCDARVLVKPYKEKGKVPDKYRKLQHQQQKMERGEFSACGGPTGLDSRDPYDLQHGARIFGDTTQAKTYCGERNWWNKLTCSKPLSSKVGD